MTLLCQNRQALLTSLQLYLTKGTDRRKLVIIRNKFIIKSSLIVIGLHDVNVFFETMISNRDPNTKYQIFLASKKYRMKIEISVFYTVLIKQLIWLVRQGTARSKRILGYWRKNSWVKCIALAFFFNRARFSLARLACFTLWTLFRHKIQIYHFCTGSSFSEWGYTDSDT